MADQTIRLRLAKNAGVAGAIPVGKGRNLRSIRIDCQDTEFIDLDYENYH